LIVIEHQSICIFNGTQLPAKASASLSFSVLFQPHDFDQFIDHASQTNCLQLSQKKA